jgi:predicted GTPase
MSSVINMLLPESSSRKAVVKSTAVGCTFDFEKYEADIDGTGFNLFDTAGLNEGVLGKVAHLEALKKLYALLQELSASDSPGVHLLVLLMKFPRITESAVKNYRLFHEFLCQKQVPIILLTTHCESEENIGDWWDNNRYDFQKQGMTFDAQACITAAKGKRKAAGYMFQEEYDTSKEQVKELLTAHYREEGWKKVRLQFLIRLL